MAYRGSLSLVLEIVELNFGMGHFPPIVFTVHQVKSHTQNICAHSHRNIIATMISYYKQPFKTFKYSIVHMISIVHVTRLFLINVSVPEVQHKS